MPRPGTDAVEIPGRGGRPPRHATVCLAAWVVRIWEPEPPPGVTEPLEWLLLCSVPTQTLAELRQRRDWYSCRWMIEVFHDLEKNGCREEERRFETVARQEACLAILSVVAVRLYQLRSAWEVQPHAAAEQTGTAAEIQIVRQLIPHAGPTLTVREFVRGIAKLGGFWGRKGDGEPGVRTLWRGYQRLQDLLLGFHLHASVDSKEAKKCW